MKGRKDEEKPVNYSKLIGICLLVVVVILFFFIFYLEYQEQNINNHAKSNTPGSIQNKSSDENVNARKPDNEVLASGEGLEIVKAHCTSCHSAKLIVQNRATREGWLNMIRWMQQTQNLWDLGEHEDIILDYLSTHYPPEEKGRRENLKDIEWYNYNGK